MKRCIFCRGIIWPWQPSGEYASTGFYQKESITVYYHKTYHRGHRKETSSG